MGAARRNARRAAREAGKQLLAAGLTPGQIGQAVSNERVKKFYLRVIDAAEKKIDGGESKVSVREGIAAAKEITRIKEAQLELGQAEEPPEQETPPRTELEQAHQIMEDGLKKAAEIMNQVPAGFRQLRTGAATINQ